MNRTISGFHQDALGEWVAELDCGHDQHVRHRPPFEQRPWVLSDGERAGRIGTGRDCPLCDRAQLPRRVERLNAGPAWDEGSLPDGLRRAHRLPAGRWGVLAVLAGSLRYSFDQGEVVLGEGETRAIPPEVEHRAEPLGPVRVRLDLYAVRPYEPEALEVVGGEAACYAHLVCPECGVVLDGGGHRDGCSMVVEPRLGGSPLTGR